MRSAPLILLLSLVGCRDPSASDAGAPAVSFAKTTLVSHPPDAAGSATAPPRDPTMICRAITVTGSVRRDTDAGLGGGEVVGDGFVTLLPGSRMAVKNGTTTREVIFEGAGDIRACVANAEEMWITGGTFKSVLGAGETPGSEVWVVTPQGVVRYGSGVQLTLAVTATRADVKVTNGTAYVDPLEPATSTLPDAGSGGTDWYAVPPNTNVSLAARQSAAQTVAACEVAAKAAHDLGVAIETHDASIAEAAPRHVVLRQKAHAICSVAELAARHSLDPVERDRLLPRARAANARWRDASLD